jgi:type IV pilus assembly protein PilB
VLAQRLVRKICTHCKEAYDPPVNVRHAMEKSVGQFDTLYRGKGCDKCRNSGYSGRIGIHELLVPGEELRQHITVAPNITQLRAMAREAGMVNLREDGFAKVKAGITTVEEVLRATAL